MVWVVRKEGRGGGLCLKRDRRTKSLEKDKRCMLDESRVSISLPVSFGGGGGGGGGGNL